MSIRVRPYVDADLPRLQATIAAWVEEAGACGYPHVGHLPHWIYATLRGQHPVGDLVHLWQDGPRIVGLTINFLFDAAFHAFVSPAWRATQVETALLRSAYETTHRYVRAGGHDDTRVVTDVFSCDDTRKALLAQLGFTQYRLWDYITERSLAGVIPEGQLPARFMIRSATMADYAQLAEARNDAFATDWTPELYRDQVMRKPGYQTAHEIVVIAPDRRIAAFTVIWLDVVNKVGLFEPVGTRPRFQRQGLARAMMLYGLRAMKQLGMETARVEHDATNLAAGALYHSLGFRKKYETVGYRSG